MVENFWDFEVWGNIILISILMMALLGAKRKNL